MNNAAPILVLIFLTVTFIQSDKIFNWKETLSWITGLFSKTFLRFFTPVTLVIIIVLELLAGIFSAVGCIQLIVNGERVFGFYGGVFSCLSLICLLFGQRIVRDYDGARTITIYFIPAIMVVYWLG
jgi:drug/metabolite transporter superfamily protein YnfA